MVRRLKAAKEMEPALTTVRLPAKSIGQIAGEQLATSIVQDDATIRRTNCEITLLDRVSAIPVTIRPSEKKKR